MIVAWGLAVCLGCLPESGERLVTTRPTESPHAVRVTFTAMGDVPYSPEEAELLKEQVAELPEESDFTIHLGDIKPGFFPCLGQIYESVADTLREAENPVFIIPGDNEWNDCPRTTIGPRHWRRFLQGLDEHWDHSFEVYREEEYAENFSFVHNRVLFVGLNILGGRILDQEVWDARLTACGDFLRERVETHSRDADFLVVFGHAGPSESQTLFFDRLVETARWFGKPVLYLHGDGHTWRQDKPFSLSTIHRVQVDQGGHAPPVIVKVVSGDIRNPFQFDRGERYE